MSIINHRHSKKGLVFDIESRFESKTGTVCLKITNTYLARAVKLRNDDSLSKLVCFDEEQMSLAYIFVKGTGANP